MLISGLKYARPLVSHTLSFLLWPISLLTPLPLFLLLPFFLHTSLDLTYILYNIIGILGKLFEISCIIPQPIYPRPKNNLEKKERS